MYGRATEPAGVAMTPIYHITHIRNLAKIIARRRLLSDRRVRAESVAPDEIGFDHIKQRRLDEIRVPCCPGTCVGDFVPFYFCPRSVMLYVINRRPGDLRYRGGQREIVHLVSSVERAVATGRPCAFSNGNAGARYATFSADLAQLAASLDWDCISATDWRDPAVRERKQSEFLVHDEVPWEAVEQIGVIDASLATETEAAIAAAAHRPEVVVRPDWYYG